MKDFENSSNYPKAYLLSQAIALLQNRLTTNQIEKVPSWNEENLRLHQSYFVLGCGDRVHYWVKLGRQTKPKDTLQALRFDNARGYKCTRSITTAWDAAR